MIDLSFEDRQYRMMDLYAPDLSTRQMGYLSIEDRVGNLTRDIVTGVGGGSFEISHS